MNKLNDTTARTAAHQSHPDAHDFHPTPSRAGWTFRLNSRAYSGFGWIRADGTVSISTATYRDEAERAADQK